MFYDASLLKDWIVPLIILGGLLPLITLVVFALSLTIHLLNKKKGVVSKKPQKLARFGLILVVIQIVSWLLLLIPFDLK